MTVRIARCAHAAAWPHREALGEFVGVRDVERNEAGTRHRAVILEAREMVTAAVGSLIVIGYEAHRP